MDKELQTSHEVWSSLSKIEQSKIRFSTRLQSYVKYGTI